MKIFDSNYKKMKHKMKHKIFWSDGTTEVITGLSNDNVKNLRETNIVKKIVKIKKKTD